MSDPVHIISLGAGVQSSTMALMAACGEITPMPVAAIFADTQDEPKSVYDWLDWLEAELPFKVHRVTAGRLSDRALAMNKTKDGRLFSKTDIPFFTRNDDGSQGKIRQRGCTMDFKIKPIIAKARQMVGLRLTDWRKRHRTALKELAQWKKACRDARKIKGVEPLRPHHAWSECQSDPLVIQWIGISLDEISRVKESRDPWIACRWPIIEARMHRGGCLHWMQLKGYQEPPRSACYYCPFKDATEWRRLKQKEPQEFRKAVLFERKLQSVKAESEKFRTVPFLHRSLVPLDQVDFSTEEERGQLNMFNNECEGMCGV